MQFDCPKCGPYVMNAPAFHMCKDNVTQDSLEAALLSHAIRQRSKHENPVVVHKEWAERIIKESKLPNPSVQADNLVQWLGEQLEERGHGSFVTFEPNELQAIIGARDAAGCIFIRHSLVSTRLIEETSPTDMRRDVRLAFAGWERFEELKRAVKDTRRA